MKIKQIFFDIIAIVISLGKIICGIILLNLFQINSKFVFLFSSLFLMMAGCRFLVYFVFGKLEEYYDRKNFAKEGKTEK